MIDRLGKEINHEESIYYWAHKNQIPVFCPALTDGSLGDMIYFHSFKNPGLIVDIAADIRKINTIAVRARKTGAIILGGGVVKHHINNANLMVFILSYENDIRREMEVILQCLWIQVKSLMGAIVELDLMKQFPGVKFDLKLEL